ncbi:hypothetical protein [Bacillus sp. EAC]|uniref:hypothetical protein n=1 Tax=Bacillus sp. EAC TaxID=1978338 RepID=UPI000B45164B|nr:hypothetical protein [Bacillus sp. EAC]
MYGFRYITDVKEDYTALNEFLSLKELTNKMLHTFAKKMAYRIEDSIDLHYKFANPLKEL